MSCFVHPLIAPAYWQVIAPNSYTLQNHRGIYSSDLRTYFSLDNIILSPIRNTVLPSFVVEMQSKDQAKGSAEVEDVTIVKLVTPAISHSPAPR